MRRTYVGAALQKRLMKLETVAVAGPPRIQVRLWRLKRLPNEYGIEKDVLVGKQLSSENGREWVEFEELPRRDPNPSAVQGWGLPPCIDVMLVSARSELQS